VWLLEEEEEPEVGGLPPTAAVRIHPVFSPPQFRRSHPSRSRLAGSRVTGLEAGRHPSRNESLRITASGFSSLRLLQQNRNPTFRQPHVFFTPLYTQELTTKLQRRQCRGSTPKEWVNYYVAFLAHQPDKEFR
jgi:hypothetical protein